MKYNILFFLIFSILFSCDKNPTESQEIKEVPNKNSLISDPTEFIGTHKAKAMILGSFHFSNPQMDSYKEEFTVNILSDQKQKEIIDVVNKLAKFNPTKILIEVPRKEYDSIINEKYSAYLAGNFELPVNELYQIGFRLAKN